jgi:hypothetical protein
MAIGHFVELANSVLQLDTLVRLNSEKLNQIPLGTLARHVISQQRCLSIVLSRSLSLISPVNA